MNNKEKISQIKIVFEQTNVFFLSSLYVTESFK